MNFTHTLIGLHLRRDLLGLRQCLVEWYPDPRSLLGPGGLIVPIDPPAILVIVEQAFGDVVRFEMLLEVHHSAAHACDVNLEVEYTTAVAVDDHT